MIIKQSNIEELPSALFLSSKYYLNSYISQKWISKQKYIDILFLEHRRYRYDLPDYIHKNQLDKFTKLLRKDYSILNGLFLSLKELSTFYIEFHGNKPYIKTKRFEFWQNLITINSPVVILSYAIYLEYKGYDSYLTILKSIFKYSSLPTSYNTFIDKLFQNEGTSELHMHFMGTTESSLVWMDALRDPYQYTSYFQKSRESSEVYEQYQQYDINYNQDTSLTILKKAKHVREYLIFLSNYTHTSKDKISEYEWTSYLSSDFVKQTRFYFPDSYLTHPLEAKTNCKNELVNEAYMYIKIFEYLNNKPSEIVAKLLHFYILAQSFFQQLIIQQQHQYGFDQFQKITLNEIREPIERKYYKRFLQLETLYKKPLEYLEIRFAPKKTYKENRKLIFQMIEDYEKYIKDKSNKPKLVILAHFIKKKETRKSIESIIPNKHYYLREALKKQADAFLELIKNYPECRQYIKGIDAAANELHASPEVFAPAFRYLKRQYTEATLYNFELDPQNIQNANTNLYMTYHAGEDFVHLISGIRMVYEAITFLNMPPKSRIGHATALGLSVTRWRSRIGYKLNIKQGEWLDNLILFSSFLSKDSKFLSVSQVVKSQIELYYNEIYNTTYTDNIPHGSILSLAYHMRSLDPLIALKFKEPHQELNILNDVEYNFKKILNQTNLSNKLIEESRKELEKYHSAKYDEANNKLISIELDESWDDAIYFMQQELIRLLNKKEIAIETMPSSNVRISFYEQYKEHHIFNWFHPVPDKNKASETPYLVVASDDPGIFANNLRAEFVHLYEAALENGATRQETEEWITTLNNNAKQFRF